MHGRGVVPTRWWCKRAGRAPQPCQSPDHIDVYKVTTRVKVDKNGREQSITVDYVMHKIDGNWQVRDIITDDVSLSKTYRYEFNKIAKTEGIDGVIRKLESKLASL
jgi:phospholipid transport system substrate-binding protein